MIKKLNLDKALRAKKLMLMILGLICAASFWIFLVQFTLPKAKDATIEVTVYKQESQMTEVERLMYLNNLKKKEKKRMMLQPI